MKKRKLSASKSVATSVGRRVAAKYKRKKPKVVRRGKAANVTKAAIKTAVAQVLNKQREKRCIKARTPYANNMEFVTLKGNCNTSYGVGRQSGALSTRDNWTILLADVSEQYAYDGQSNSMIYRDGAAIRITAVKDAGRLKVTWPELSSIAIDNSSCARQWLNHHMFLLRFKAKKHGDLFVQNTAAGHVYRRIVYGLLRTWNKPDMSVITAATGDTLVGNDATYTGENYSITMRRPLNEEQDDAVNSWEDIRSQFTVETVRRRLYYRPRQSADTFVPSHNPGGINSSDLNVASADVTEKAVKSSCFSTHDYSFQKLYKGGLLTKYEDVPDSSETLARLSEKPLILVHTFMAQGNLEGDSVGIKVEQCYGTRSVYWSDI